MGREGPASASGRESRKERGEERTGLLVDDQMANGGVDVEMVGARKAGLNTITR